MPHYSLALLAALTVASTHAVAQGAPAQQKTVGVSELIPMSANSEHPLMKTGTPAPDFALKGTDDQVHTLAEFSQAKLLVVMFESIHCPVSENYEGRMRGLYDEYHDKGVAFVAINPNNPKAVRLDELGYTDLTDAPADMKIRVRNRQIPWPYLYDGETQSTVQKFGAVATPHVFIFDQDRKLRYEGRIDDNQNEATFAERNDVYDPADLRPGGLRLRMGWAGRLLGPDRGRQRRRVRRAGHRWSRHIAQRHNHTVQEYMSHHRSSDLRHSRLR